MVYDCTDPVTVVYTDNIIRPGYAIHKIDASVSESGITEWEIYTDDGRGNGDFVCRAADSYWAGRIARSLDAYCDR